MAPSSAPPVPVEALREAVRGACERAKMRRVSKDIGISLGGLHGFLNGAEPQASTLRKLREWYEAGAARSGEVSEQAARSAVATILAGVGKGRLRSAALDRLLDAVEEAHRRQNTQHPEWVDKLRGWEW